MRRPALGTACALLGYAAISCGYFGWRLLPHPGRYLVGTTGWLDPQAAVWCFAWWPHAILSGTNPFHSGAIFAPVGTNLVWANAIPGLAVPLAPVTLLFGPSVSYNVAAVLLPPLSAWTTFLLLRYATQSTWAAFVGGYLFGFSSFVLAHQLGGHVSLTAAFLVPLIALVLLRYLSAEIGGARLGWLLALMLGVQAYISIEVASTAAIMLILGVGLAFLAAPERRARLRASLVPLALGGLGAGVLALPLLYFALAGAAARVSHDYSSYSADLLNLVVPTTVTGLGGHHFAYLSDYFPGDTNERDSYLGWPSILIVGLLLLRRPWSVAVRVLVAFFVAATFLSLGPKLVVDGHRVIELPTALLFDLPLLQNIIPSRIALYSTLAVAALVALWIASPRADRWGMRYLLPLFAVAALVPPFWSSTFVQNPPRLAFFTSDLYKRCFPRGETLLIFPFAASGSSELWQAEDGLYFNVIGGSLGQTPARYREDPIMNGLDTNIDDVFPTAKQLVALVRRWHVDRVIAVPTMPPLVPLTTKVIGPPYPSLRTMRAFGPVEHIGGALVAPACGQPALG